MALDHSLLCDAQGGVAFLRLYRWSPPCLSFGRNEPALTRYDSDAIARLGLDTVRRPTGGRAVWHETEAVAGPADLFGSLREAYIRVHAVLAAALRRLGVDAELARRPRSGAAGPGSGPCFASPVGGEIVVAGRKLVGSAQVREGGAFLQHGSILLEVVAAVAAEARQEWSGDWRESRIHPPPDEVARFRDPGWTWRR
jgi:lipoate-protein ligase A